MKTYNYLLVDFYNGIVDLPSLKDEITASDITIAIQNITINDTVCSITFKDYLSTYEIGELDVIVSNHKGEKIDAAEIVYTKIKEEEHEGLTQGNFQATVIDIETSGNETVYKDLIFPYPISLFSAEWLVGEEHIGDQAEFHLAPDTVVGELTTSHDTGATVFNVSSTVVEYFNIGYYVKINGEELGRVLGIDKINNTITTEYPSTINNTAGSYVLMTIKVVPYWKFTGIGFSTVGESKIGASFIPANTVVRMIYHNINGFTGTKIFGISIDYLY